MTILTDHPASQVTNDLFTLAIAQKYAKTEITMQLHIPLVNTHSLPQTYTLLKKHLPRVLKTSCFNDDNLPFYKEVKHTEIGHLFEHILLEYLCQEKLDTGCRRAVFRGVTDWDWMKDSWGVFHITVSIGYTDPQVFRVALEKSTFLLCLLLRSASPLPDPAPVVSSLQIN